MPGKILKVLCGSGDFVEKGDGLLILEAMKMENLIKSPKSGQVQEIKIANGENVEKNQILITFD